MLRASTLSLFSDSLYKNWWEPPDEIVTIKPSDTKKVQKNAGTLESSKAEAVSVMQLLECI